MGKSIIIGNEHTILLSRSGEVYTAGYNDNGQCGIGTTQRVAQVTLVEKLSGKGALQVHAYNGCEHTLVVMQVKVMPPPCVCMLTKISDHCICLYNAPKDGRLVSFGYNYRGQLGHGTTASEPIPRLVKGLENKRVDLVSCSYYHSIVSCDNGDIYSFGRNDYGQLGHGDTIDKKVPHLVHSLHGRTAVSLACGQYHTMVATNDGQLFSCGKNDYGQLCLDTTEGQKHMVLVGEGGGGAMESSKVLEVRCGYYHSIILCEGGRVFGAGRNDYGQLGLGHIAQRVHGPQLIEAVEGKDIVRIAAGCYHTVLVGKNGMLYVCGRNNHGQLGTGDTNERHAPHAIDLFLGKRVAMVAAGFYHTVILTGGIEADMAINHAENHDFSAFSPTTFLDLPSFSMPSIDGDNDGQVDRVEIAQGQETVVETAVQVKEEGPVSRDDDSLEVSAELPEGSLAGSDLLLDKPENNVADAENSSLADPASSPPRLQHSTSSPAVLSSTKTKSASLAVSPALPVTAALSSTSQHRANKETSLCSQDGTITAEKAAIFVLAQMDRLSTSLCPHPVFPPALASSKNTNASMLYGGKCFNLRTYYVDVSPETLELLFCLLTYFAQSDPRALLDQIDLGDDSINFVYAYCILACLRILRANLLHLLMNESVSQKIRDMMQNINKGNSSKEERSVTDSFDDLVSLDGSQESMLNATHSHVAQLLMDDSFLGTWLWSSVLL